MSARIRFLAPVIPVLVACFGLLAEAAPNGPPAGLFESTDLLEVELIGPVSSVLKDRDERNEQRFVLAHDGIEQAVRVRVRGHSRSRRSICTFPPLRFRFEDGVGAFAGQEKLKLVTHCRNGERGDASAMAEYAAYRIFNLLSPLSLRVRPLRLTYTDTDGRLDRNARQRYGFLIEPVEQLAERTDGERLELDGVALAWLDPEQAALVYVFQYLIGNTDWSFIASDDKAHCCHNGRLLRVDGLIDYVPYDFDLAGLVDAHYAKPDPSLRLRSVRQRRYRGFCTDPDVLARAIRRVVEQEEAILDVIRTVPGLDEKRRAKALAYLGDFFEEARDENELLERFEKRCL
ncbi:MAG: hypothetical protein P8Y52_02650 [Xanthomonadales bacterium]